MRQTASPSNTSRPNSTLMLSRSTTRPLSRPLDVSHALEAGPSTYDELKILPDEPFVRQRIVEIANTEAIHVKTLKGALGKQATSACTYTFPYNSVSSFLALSAAIEGVGVSAYLGAAPLITSKDYRELWHTRPSVVDQV